MSSRLFVSVVFLVSNTAFFRDDSDRRKQKKDAAKGGGGRRRLRFLRVPFLFVFSGCVVAHCSGRMDRLSTKYILQLPTTQLPFQIHHLGSQNIFFLCSKVGFLVKCIASRLQTNNELFTFPTKKKVFQISARRTTTRPRETCGFDVVVVVSRVRSVGAVRATKRGDPRGRTMRDSRFLGHFPFLFRVRKICVWGGGGFLVEIRFAQVFFSAMWGRRRG